MISLEKELLSVTGPTVVKDSVVKGNGGKKEVLVRGVNKSFIFQPANGCMTLD